MKIYFPLNSEEKAKYNEETAKFRRFYLWHKTRFHALLNCEAEKGGEEWRLNQISYLTNLYKNRLETYYRNIGI